MKGKRCILVIVEKPLNGLANDFDTKRYVMQILLVMLTTALTVIANEYELKWVVFLVDVTQNTVFGKGHACQERIL